MRTGYKMAVLLLGHPNGEARDVADAILRRCPDADIFYATTDREAQRQVRAQQFAAIVAVQGGFIDFCASMVPHMMVPGSILDVIVVNDRNFELPYGLVGFESATQAAEQVYDAINHQKGMDDMHAHDRTAVPISAPPVPRDA